jgi:hypothetical protein
MVLTLSATGIMTVRCCAVRTFVFIIQLLFLHHDRPSFLSIFCTNVFFPIYPPSTPNLTLTTTRPLQPPQPPNRIPLPLAPPSNPQPTHPLPHPRPLRILLRPRQNLSLLVQSPPAPPKSYPCPPRIPRCVENDLEGRRW